MTGFLSLFLLKSAITGELCVDRACSAIQFLPLASQVVPIARSDQTRAFTWVARDGSQAVFGTIPAGEELVLDTSTKGEMLIRAQTRHDRLPAFEVVVSRPEGIPLWEIEIEPKDTRHELRLHVPPGDYGVVVRTSRDRMEPEDAVPVRVVAGKTAEVPAWKLIRRLRGSVLETRTRKPIPDAEIEGADGRLLAVADAEGHFVIDDPQPPLKRDLVVHAPGFGTRWIDLQLDAAEVGAVELYRGSTVILQVDSPNPGEAVPLEIRMNEGHRDGARILAKQKGMSGERIQLVDIAPGEHRLFISGPEELQHYSRTLEVSGADVEVIVALEPIEVRGIVTYGDDVVSAAKVEIKGDGGWRAEVLTDDSGSFGGEMWDNGDLLVSVTAASLSLPYATMSRGGKQNPRFLDIRIPATIIRGRVTADGKSVADARVDIQSFFEEVQYSRGARTGNEGQFEVAGVPAGRHVLSIAAEGFLQASVEVETAVDDAVREVDISLERGRDVVIEVRSEDGQRLPGALIAVGMGSDGVAAERNVYTGSDGRARLTIGPSAVKNIFVVDGVGRFAQAVISAEGPGEATIVVPSAEGSILLTVLDTEGKPVPDVGFAARFNGVPVPQITLVMMLRARQIAGVTGRDGTVVISRLPAGRYELFPSRSSAEITSVLRSPIARKAPIDLTLDGRSAVPITVRIRKLETNDLSATASTDLLHAPVTRLR